MEKTKHAFIRQFEPKKRRQVMGFLKAEDNIRRQEIELLERGLLQPLRDLRKLNVQAQQNMIPVDHYHDQSKKVSKMLKEVILWTQTK